MWLRSGSGILFWKRLSPTAKDVDNLIRQAEGILSELKQKAEILREPPDAWLAPALEQSVLEVKRAILRDGVVDEERWGGKTEQEKWILYNYIYRTARTLRCLNLDEIRMGKCYFGLFVAILAGLVIAYLVLHAHPSWTASRGVRINSDKIVNVSELLNRVELKIKAVREADSEKVAQDPELAKVKEDLRKALLPLDLTFDSFNGFGQVLAEVEAGQIAKTETWAKFRKALEAELEGLTAGYFWLRFPYRWFEFAWWAEFGTLVGLLYYIAGLLGMGLFRVEEVSMFWTEILITPLVVIVVFFLFGYTGITGLQPSETSLTVNVGFAFILGFAIRRTVGFLDIIKKRFFPEPTPVGKSAS